MRAVFRYSGLLVIVGCAAPAPGGAPEGEQTSELATRPANVPADFVVTPAGYFHPSCVNLVRDDERVRGDGKIENARGGVRDLAPCAYPHYDKLGRAIDASAARQSKFDPTVNGWVEDGYAVLPPLNFMQAEWQVPTAPYSAGGQTLYYFPGLEDINHVVTIVQPVLGWYQGRWTLASWNCCVNGNVNQSSPINARPGDMVFGVTSGSNCSNGVCANWSIFSANRSTGQGTTLNTSGYGQTFNWAFGGVLEAYNVNSCQQYAASGKVTFHDITLRTTDGASLDPGWTPQLLGASPSCGYAVSSGARSVTVATAGTVPGGVLTPAPPTSCGRLNPGEGITAGGALASCDGRFTLQMQLDGNLVLYQGGTALWSNNRAHTSDFSAVMQGDGNFVVYDLASIPRFATNTSGNPGAWLALQNDGNVVVYSSGGAPLWASNTCCH